MSVSDTLEHVCLLGQQPAEGAHEADLRDAGYGPPLRGGCDPPIAARLIFTETSFFF